MESSDGDGVFVGKTNAWLVYQLYRFLFCEG